MKTRLHGRSLALLVGSLLVMQWAVDAQSQSAAGKRPLTYEAVDSWRSIGGTRLSDDGQWLVYSVTSQAEDGELLVRNLKTSQEYKHPRGTGAQFTPDGKFVIFTIAQLKADEERERLQNRGRGAEGGETPGAGAAAPGAAEPPAAASGGRQGGAAGRGQGNQQRRTEPRTGLGIMSLGDGTVTTVDKVGSFRLADQNPIWLA
ncbi:MAG: hypothetical protein H0W08_11675, partial [Acidobacteria bacterium]|nr:hypothetical protein [Acidobacteriota bacterium]